MKHNKFQEEIKLPKGFGKLPKLPKLPVGLAEIFGKPIDPNEHLPPIEELIKIEELRKKSNFNERQD